MTIETTIRGGLPVLASAEVHRAEPDVGVMGPYVEGIEVTFLSGHPIPFEISDKDDQRIADELVEAYNEPPWD